MLVQMVNCHCILEIFVWLCVTGRIGHTVHMFVHALSVVSINLILSSVSIARFVSHSTRVSHAVHPHY